MFADVDKESTPVETHEVPQRAPDTICIRWCGTLEPRMTIQKIIELLYVHRYTAARRMATKATLSTEALMC